MPAPELALKRSVSKVPRSHRIVIPRMGTLVHLQFLGVPANLSTRLEINHKHPLPAEVPLPCVTHWHSETGTLELTEPVRTELYAILEVVFEHQCPHCGTIQEVPSPEVTMIETVMVRKGDFGT